MIISVFDRLENIVGKGGNAGYQHFPLFPQCFEKDSLQETSKGVIVWEWVKTQESSLKFQLVDVMIFISTNRLPTCKTVVSYILIPVTCKRAIRLNFSRLFLWGYWFTSSLNVFNPPVQTGDRFM